MRTAVKYNSHDTTNNNCVCFAKPGTSFVKNGSLDSRNRIYPVLLIASVLAVYFPMLNNNFLYYWDDQWMVMNEYTEGGINLRNLISILTTAIHGQHAPVNHILFLLLYNIVGYNAFYFHLTCLLHIVFY